MTTASEIVIRYNETFLPAASDVGDYNYAAGTPTRVPFGNTFAQTAVYSTREGQQQALLGTLEVSRLSAGSGGFGPANADFALMVNAVKTNWKTSTVEGEIIPLYAIARQGKKGDVSGLLVDIEKRRDNLTSLGNDETGAGVGFEVAAKLRNAADTVYHDLHAIVGFPESVGGVSGGRGFGFLSSPRVGQWHSGYHSELKGGTVLYHFSASTGSTPQTLNYGVTVDGYVVQGFPSERVAHGYDAATDLLRFQDGNGAFLFGIGRTSKVATSQGGYQIASGASLIFQNHGNFTSTTTDAYVSLSGGTLGNKPISGAVPGDHVDVALTSADPGLAGALLSGVVVSPNQVQIRLQNASSGTLPAGVTLAYSVVVRRFNM